MSEVDRVTAIHEAAHFVIAIVGYECGGTPVKYSEKSEDDIPHILSIEKDGDMLGFSDANSNDEINKTSLLPNKHRPSWHIVRLLAGFAAERSYELSDAYTDEYVEVAFNECRGPRVSEHDFCKASRWIVQIMDYRINQDVYVDYEEIYTRNVKTFWKETLDIISMPLIRRFINETAAVLIVKRTMYKEDIRILRNSLEALGLNESSGVLAELCQRGLVEAM